MAEFIKRKASDLASNSKQSNSNLHRSTSKGRGPLAQFSTQSGDNIALVRTQRVPSQGNISDAGMVQHPQPSTKAIKKKSLLNFRAIKNNYVVKN